MRAVLYLRQSMDRSGAGSAIERQQADCLRLCEERGWEVVGTYIDNDVSASSRKPRPQYKRMVAALEAGGADVLVAWHIDRLTRRMTDLEALIELAERTGLKVVTVTGDIDLSNDAGRLVGRILASVARGEVERKGARQKRAQQQAAEAGRPSGGRRAFGYDRTGSAVIEDEASLVRDGFDSLIAGRSLKSIARAWNAAGCSTTAGGEWNHGNVRGVLKNPRYAGLRTYRGAVVGPASWPAIVNTETFEAARSVLRDPDRRTTSSTARKHLLPGLALCHRCGSDVATGHTRHGKRVYVCRAKKCVSRKADPVDELVGAVVVARLSQPDALAVFDAPAEGNESQMRTRMATIRARLEDLTTALEEGILPFASVRASSDRLRAELSLIEAQLSGGGSARALRTLAEASDVQAAWDACDLQQRRSVIESLMRVTLLAPERGQRAFDPESVHIEWRGLP